MHRRDFLAGAAILGASAAMSSAASALQQSGEATNTLPMNQDAARSVRRPPKPNAVPSMTPGQRDDLEKGLRCQCGCTLDVYTCRTTDFSCQVSPAMHRDIMSLVEGGYSADEIIAAFVDSYGERALMAPTTEGFNLVGWIAPFAAIGTGAVVLAILLRRWKSRAAAAALQPAGPASAAATPDELARLQAAIRDDA